LTLTFDHDIIDGAPAARFVQRFKEFLEMALGYLKNRWFVDSSRQASLRSPAAEAYHEASYEAYSVDFQAPMQVSEIMKGFPLPWGICGGWALDLYLDRMTRVHKDVELAILRRDQLALQKMLLDRGWNMEIASKGTLTKWEPGILIQPPLHTIWCRHGSNSLDFFEILLNEAEEDRFYFRRDARVQMELSGVFEGSASGISILTPEIVLLYMATEQDPASRSNDFLNSLASLPTSRMMWLRDSLKLNRADHPWLNVLTNWNS
jgi:hypothetical protein